MAVALPIESNPETMSQYLHKLGVSNQWRLVDVLGLDKEALTSLPNPVLALILLFPLSDAYEANRTFQEIKLKDQKSELPDIFHLKQVLSNICGTIALVHSIANNTHAIEVDGILKKFLDDAKKLEGPAARGALLENTPEILNAYKEVADVEEQEDGEIVNNHFITFIHKDGHLYELDGRKSAPIDHGPTTAETFVQDAAKVCREFIAKEPDSIGFNVVALVPNQ